MELSYKVYYGHVERSNRSWNDIFRALYSSVWWFYIAYLLFSFFSYRNRNIMIVTSIFKLLWLAVTEWYYEWNIYLLKEVIILFFFFQNPNPHLAVYTSAQKYTNVCLLFTECNLVTVLQTKRTTISSSSGKLMIRIYLSAYYSPI